MVFMDGTGYAKSDGAFRVPVVFDNLIHQKAMPVTIAVFVNPGTIPATKPGAKDRSNRSFEYDSLGDRYAKFLVDEFLPVALKGLNVSNDPKQRAVCGISSGGICAFTVAWEKPDQFGKVLSHIGSFTNIRGGWAYPGLVRKTQGHAEADQGLSAGRQGRPQQSARQLAAGERRPRGGPADSPGTSTSS